MDIADGLALLALTGCAGAVLSLVQLHRVAPEVAPLRGAVSDYGAGSHASWYRAQVVMLGIAAAALWLGLRAGDLDGDGGVWLLVFALSRVAIAGFPVDLPGASRTRTGVVHNVLAATAFASSAVAASTLGGRLGDDPLWALDGAWYGWVGGLVTVVAVVLAVVWVLPVARRSVFGLVERCWYAATITWLALTALGLLLSG